MRLRVALTALALILAGCNQQAGSDAPGAGPQLEDPAPETEPSRVFATTNDAAAATTGQLTAAMTLHLADASSDSGDSQEVLTLTGANGVIVEAELTGAVSPATQVQGQTLRALLGIPVEEPQVLVYRVRNETRPSGRGICGADNASNVIVWEPAGPGEPVMKVLGLVGGAPGAAGARACPLLEYRRQ
jgi:hypothetical protein